MKMPISGNDWNGWIGQCWGCEVEGIAPVIVRAATRAEARAALVDHKAEVHS